jgi:hypothetical protein
MNELPQFLRDLLASPPRSGDQGGGVHRWMFRVARHLHTHRSFDDSFALLRACVEDCGRTVPEQEIWDAIKHSQLVAWRPQHAAGADHESESGRRWPPVNAKWRATIIRDYACSVYDWWESSPVRYEDSGSHAEEILPVLFPNNPLVCIGWQKNAALTDHLSAFRGELGTLQFIVPSPMSKPTGSTQEGRASPRCLDNTAPRRFLVVEFDSSSEDDQASLLAYLTTRGPLVLVMFSGGKSLHAWFCCTTHPEERVQSFMSEAVKLGADPATWTPCQFVRMPDGTRDTGRQQTVLYFRPEAIR